MKRQSSTVVEHLRRMGRSDWLAELSRVMLDGGELERIPRRA